MLDAKLIAGDEYRTPPKAPNSKTSFFNKIWNKLSQSSLFFYLRYISIITMEVARFHRVKIKPHETHKLLLRHGLLIVEAIEKHGLKIIFEGMNNFPPEDGPYVFASNHTSRMEVHFLSSLLSMRMPIGFVVKSALVKIPYFGAYINKFNMIPIKRSNPGEDLIVVLEKGKEYLDQGISVFLFPEGTRQRIFSPKKFNSLAVKLARKANVKVVPVAIRSDFEAKGRFFEFGSIRKDNPIRISFGKPISLTGRGKAEQQLVVDYIKSHLIEWGFPVEL